MNRNRRGFLFGLIGIAAGIGAKMRLAHAAPPTDPTANILWPGSSSPLDRDQLRTRGSWVTTSLRDIKRVQPGMTRAELMVLFEAAGGLTITHANAPLIGTYSYRNCPNFKVDVEFAPVNKPHRNANGYVSTTEDPRDTITKISRPYLDDVYSD